MMANFPDLPITSFKFKTKKEIYQATYDGGYTQTRPKYTRSVKTFTFSLTFLTQAEATEVDDFLTDTRGLSFTFTHPINDTSHTVRLLEDFPEFEMVSGFNYYSASAITLEEV